MTAHAPNQPEFGCNCPNCTTLRELQDARKIGTKPKKRKAKRPYLIG